MLLDKFQSSRVLWRDVLLAHLKCTYSNNLKLTNKNTMHMHVVSYARFQPGLRHTDPRSTHLLIPLRNRAYK